MEPLSPDATHTVMPMVAAAWKASSMAVIACEVHVDSGPPQLMEMHGRIVGRVVNRAW